MSDRGPSGDGATARADVGVGSLLRDWRRRRRLSQMELALDAGISTRHLSFVETGRSKPSPEMVLRLADQLAVPLRDRNRLLLAAGFAPSYGERPLDHPDMAPVHAAVQRLLAAHDPFPAVAVDQHWNLVSGNHAFELVTAGVAPELLEQPCNCMRLALHPDGLAPRILNLGEWRAHLLARLRRHIELTGDDQMVALEAELRGYPGAGREHAPSTEDVFVELRMSVGDGELAFFSTISTFGTAVDITLAELSIECFFPADAATTRTLQELAGAPAPS